MPPQSKSRSIGLTITRVLLCLIILKDLALYTLYADELLGIDGIVPILTYAQFLEYVNMPYLFVNFTNSVVLYTFLGVAITAACAFLVGYRAMLSGLVLFFCMMTIKLRALFTQDGADNVIGTMLPLLLLCSTYNLLTGKRNNQFKREWLQWVPFLAGVGVLYEFCLIYFTAGLSKAVQPVWQSGEALYYILRIEDFRASSLNVALTEYAFFVKGSTWFTLFWELTFPFVIWFSRKIRNLYLLAGIALHIGIWMLMRIDNFSIVMLSIYPVFFLDTEYKVLYRRYLKKWEARFAPVLFTQTKLQPHEPAQ
jgi:hypothetical protein